MSKLKPGDVYDYTPMDDKGRVEHHCREGQATVAEFPSGMFLLDNFWGSGNDRHQLTAAELKTATFDFNLNDYDTVEGRDSAAKATWETFHPDDRKRSTAQHGLQVRYLIRKGAKPNLETQIANARFEVEQAESSVRSAEFRLQMRRNDLESLVGAL